MTTRRRWSPGSRKTCVVARTGSSVATRGLRRSRTICSSFFAGSAGLRNAGLARTSPLLWAPQRYLSACAGPNDGLVPLASQAWGEVLLELEADHFAQIGWSLRFDAAELFEELLRELRARGF